MTAITLVRHAQASFGAKDYDRLSQLGHEQARALGHALARLGFEVGKWFTGTQRRHRETLEGLSEGLGAQVQATVHEGLNEFDFRGLLAARFRDAPLPEGLNSDRRLHFRTLRDTVLAWQRDEIVQPPESFSAFRQRVAKAVEAMRQAGCPVLAVSSGGAISQIVASSMGAPDEQMIRLQLQMRNASVSRLRAGRSALYLDGFNETPHVTAAEDLRLLTWS